MKKVSSTTIATFIVLTILSELFGANSVQAAPDEPTRADSAVMPAAASRVVGFADAFLATLDERQKAKVLYKFDDKEQRSLV